MNFLNDPGYEDIVGTPWDVQEDAAWLSCYSRQFPLRRLTAQCLSGWHENVVGEPFRWSDEQIRLDETRTVSWEQWRKYRNNFQRVWVLRCDQCGRDTRHAAKGATSGL